MARKIDDISKGEMLRMRAEGLSNRDIAKCLDIHYATVYNYIGPQGGRMDNLAAFDEPKPKKVETPKEDPKPSPKAVDSLGVVAETVRSANGVYQAQIEYELEVVEVLGSTISFGGLAELATFIIGLASRVEQKGEAK